MSPGWLVALLACSEAGGERPEVPDDTGVAVGRGTALAVDTSAPAELADPTDTAPEEIPPDLGSVGDDGAKPASGDATGAPWTDSPFVQIAASGIVGALCTEGWIDGFGAALNLTDHADYTRVAVGGAALCGLRAGGTWDCEHVAQSHGDDPDGGAYVEIAIDLEYGCGLDSNGELGCWGWDPAAEDPPEGVGYTSVAIGRSSACALDVRGEIACWSGRNAETPLPKGPFRQIALFEDDAGGCGLHAAGDIACWLADFTPEAGHYVSIASGGLGLCAIDGDGALHCWGPHVSNPPAGTFSQVAVAGRYACALDSDGGLQCWSDEELDPHLYPPDSLCVKPAAPP